MKFSLPIVKLVLCFLFIVEPVYAEKIRLEKSTLSEFVQVVSDYLDKPVIVATDLKQPFFFNGNFQTKEELKALFKTSVISYGLNYEETEQSIVISGDKPLSAVSQALPVESAQNVVKPDLNSVSLSPPFLVSYPLHYLSTESVYPTLSKMVKSSVYESAANNTLLVTASAKEHAQIKRYLKVLDVPVNQVLIEAVITELSDTDYAGLDSKMQNLANLNTALNDLAVYAVPNPLTSMATFGMKLLTSKSLRFFLDWVHTLDNSSVLSQPKIVTLDRKPASIIVGQNVPFVTGKSTGQASSTATPFQTIERRDIGLSLHVTPLVLPNGTIQLTIAQESSSVDPNTLASDIVTNKRSITSTAIIKDGESLMLGGLSSKAVSDGHTDTIPYDIPVLNWFFSGNTKRVANTNLVVLISAKVLPVIPAANLQGQAAGITGEN